MPANFFDTNVLIYIASGDAEKAGQVEAAIALGGAISVQVLNELTNVARRKMQMSWAETHEFL
ncbi:MAG: VapC toxin family PIN domain ribonuclease, partial [Rhodomicrobium sp.]